MTKISYKLESERVFVLEVNAQTVDSEFCCGFLSFQKYFLGNAEPTITPEKLLCFIELVSFSSLFVIYLTMLSVAQAI
jgi:hypothetical protein